MQKQFNTRKYIIKIKTSAINQATWDWYIQENEFMKVEWKVYLFNNDYPNKKIRFEVIRENSESVIIKACIDGYSDDWAQVHSEGIAEVNKKIITKNWEFDNRKVIEKAQSIALGKALSYLWYGLEYWLATAEEMQDYMENNKKN